MSKKYNSIMEEIKVSEEMHERVMAGVRSAAVSEKKISRFPVRRIVAVAACAVLLTAGAVALPLISERQENDPPTLISPEFTKCKSSAELSESVGFEVKDIADALPFEPVSVEYTSLSGELAEITYTGAEQSAVYRVSLGSEDNSGDYNAYDMVSEVNADDITVTLKGSKSGYSLAIWQSGGMSYSLALSCPAEAEVFMHVVS